MTSVTHVPCKYCLHMVRDVSYSCNILFIQLRGRKDDNILFKKLRMRIKFLMKGNLCHFILHTLKVFHYLQFLIY